MMKNVLVLVRALITKNRVERELKRLNLYSDCNLIFDTFGSVYDRSHLSGVLGKHLVELKLDGVNLPENQFLVHEMFSLSQLRDGAYAMSEIDSILVVMLHPWWDLDKEDVGILRFPEDVLAVKYCMEYLGLPDVDVKCGLVKGVLASPKHKPLFDTLDDFDAVYGGVIQEVSV